MYNEYDHSNGDDIYAACSIDKEIVKRIHEKIMTDIRDKDRLSEVIELLEISLLDENTTAKMARPVAVILVKMMMEEINRERVIDSVTSTVSKIVGGRQGKSVSDLDLSKDEIENYVKNVISRHKQPKE